MNCGGSFMFAIYLFLMQFTKFEHSYYIAYEGDFRLQVCRHPNGRWFIVKILRFTPYFHMHYQTQTATPHTAGAAACQPVHAPFDILSAALSLNLNTAEIWWFAVPGIKPSLRIAAVPFALLNTYPNGSSPCSPDSQSASRGHP